MKQTRLSPSWLSILVWGLIMLTGHQGWPYSLPAEFKNLKSLPHVKVDLRYATTNNFMNKNVYGDFKEAHLHEVAFNKLKVASENLAKEHPGYKLLIYDALRPQHVQKQLFAFVAGTDKEQYVANPAKGSLHSFGFAVDLTVIDDKGKELDMGSGFDDFRDLSQPKLEEKYLTEGKLTDRQLKNRLVLRKPMEDAGFKVLPHEWWHFDALPGDQVRTKYKIVE